jgi:hypothetical protein
VEPVRPVELDDALEVGDGEAALDVGDGDPAAV